MKYLYPAGRRLFLKLSLPSACFIVRTTVSPTRLLQLRPFSSRTFVMSNCDHGLAQLRLPVLVRGVHAYTSWEIDLKTKAVPWMDVNSRESGVKGGFKPWKEVLKCERRIPPEWVCSTNLASMVYRPVKRIEKIYLLKIMDSLARVTSIVGTQRV